MASNWFAGIRPREECGCGRGRGRGRGRFRAWWIGLAESTAGARTEVQKFGGFFFTKARLGCRGLTRVGPRSTQRFRRPGPGIVDPCRKGERGRRSRAVLQRRPSRFLLVLQQRVQGTVKKTKICGKISHKKCNQKLLHMPGPLPGRNASPCLFPALRSPITPPCCVLRAAWKASASSISLCSDIHTIHRNELVSIPSSRCSC